MKADSRTSAQRDEFLNVPPISHVYKLSERDPREEGPRAAGTPGGGRGHPSPLPPARTGPPAGGGASPVPFRPRGRRGGRIGSPTTAAQKQRGIHETGVQRSSSFSSNQAHPSSCLYIKAPPFATKNFRSSQVTFSELKSTRFAKAPRSRLHLGDRAVTITNSSQAVFSSLNPVPTKQDSH